MSETLRDLVVSLSLDSDNFSRNLSSINKQITEAESRFKAAGAGVSGFETSAAGLGAQLSMLQQKQALQSKAVDQYQRALTSANTKLTDSVARHDKLKASLEQAKAKQTELGTAVAKASQYYEKQKAALGENDSATIAAKENLDGLKDEYSATSEEVKKLEGQLKASDKAMQNAADGVSKAETNLNNAQAALRETEAEIGRVNARLAAARSSWLSAAATLEKLGNKALAAGKNMTALGKSLSMKVTAPVVALGASAVKTFASFDDAMRQVQATMNASAEDTAKLTAAAKNMGIATRYTASEAANALNYLALAGYDADKAISALSTVLNLAQAGSIDLATSSDMVTDSMAALGLNMGQMSDFSDQMARTAQKCRR